MPNISFNNPKRQFVLLVAFLVGASPGFNAKAAETTNPEGRWTGMLEQKDPDLGNIPLSEISLVFSHDADRTLRAKCYAAVWGEAEWPLDVKLTPGQPALILDLVTHRGAHGRLEFATGFGGDEVSGTYSYEGLKCTVLLRKVQADERPRHKMSQVPVPPLPHIYDRVNFKNGSTALSGLLILPKGAGPFPVAILIPGSDPCLAEPDVPGNPRAYVWFWVIAHSLARHGIATLQTDSRGLGGSAGSFEQMTLQDAASDVRASIAFLGTRKEIDRNRIGLLGHSMGTAVAALAASDATDLRFLVLLAGVGMPGDQCFLEQIDMDWSDGHLKSHPARKLVHQMDAKLFEMAKAGIAAKEITRQLRNEFGGRPEMSRWADEAQIEAQATRVTYPRWRSFLTYQPSDTLARCRLPVLAIGGGSDTFVNAKRNLALIEAAVKSGRNENVKVMEVPGLSHTLKHVTGEYDPAEIIDSATLESIAQWTKIASFWKP